MDDLLSRLAEALQAKVDEVPAEWRTAEQIAREAGKAPQTACRYLREGMRAGLIESRTFRIHSGARIYPVPHYRETTPGGSKK
jgi:predicted transcriptional regulator